MGFRTFFAGLGINVVVGTKLIGWGALTESEELGGWQNPNFIDGYTFNPADGQWYASPPAPDLGQFGWLNPGSSALQGELNSKRETRLIDNWIEGRIPDHRSWFQRQRDNIADLYRWAERVIVRRDPLTLDLDGDGLETLATTAGVLFDHDGDGVATGTGWVYRDDGFLVWDRNGNGLIDSGRELFGDSTLKSNGQFAVDGFDALADLDFNVDGKVDALDPNFANLRLWRDMDADGVSDVGELSSLASLGIAGFNTGKTANNQVLPDGNRIADLGTYIKSDGSTATMGDVGQMADIDLSEDTFNRRFSDQIPLTAQAEMLPTMQASGLVRDMREAASLQTIEGSAFAMSLSSYAGLATRSALSTPK